MKWPPILEERPPPFSRPLRSQQRHRQINRRLQRNPQRRQQPSPSRSRPKRDVSPANVVSISPMSAARAPAEKFLLPIFSPLPNPNPAPPPPPFTAAAPPPPPSLRAPPQP